MKIVTPPASRLVLMIGPIAYQLTRLRNSWDDGVAFRIRKRDGTAYDIIDTPFGPSCDCADFVFRRDGLDPRGCKHVRALAETGFLAAGPARLRIDPSLQST